MFPFHCSAAVTQDYAQLRKASCSYGTKYLPACSGPLLTTRVFAMEKVQCSILTLQTAGCSFSTKIESARANRPSAKHGTIKHARRMSSPTHLAIHTSPNRTIRKRTSILTTPMARVRMTLPIPVRV